MDRKRRWWWGPSAAGKATPGAFVGMLLGGASPLEAARVQLTVLFALLGAGALAAALVTLLIARVVIQPGERIRVPALR